MPTFSAICLSLGITCMLWSFQSIHNYWIRSETAPTTPWPHTKRYGVICGLLFGLGLCSWLLPLWG